MNTSLFRVIKNKLCLVLRKVLASTAPTLVILFTFRQYHCLSWAFSEMWHLVLTFIVFEIISWILTFDHFKIKDEYTISKKMIENNMYERGK